MRRPRLPNLCVLALLTCFFPAWTPAARAQGEAYSAVLACSEKGGAVTIRLSGIWRDCCAPHTPMISVTGNRIDFQMDFSASGGCCDGPTPWCGVLTTAPLPDGVYRVFTTILPDGGPVERAPFVVDCATCTNCRLTPLPHTPGGVNGPVYAMTNWDPDGAGPQPEFLIVGGDFTQAGGVAASNIAAWDGQVWRPLGAGVGGPTAGVYALTVFDGQLIAAGYFTLAGGAPASSIARWNGVEWQPLGEGVGSPSYPTILVMTVYNAELIVGGVFFTAGDVRARRIARWDGAYWSALGEGVGADDTSPFDAVFSLATYNADLIVGGAFRRAGGLTVRSIARWDGTDWHTMHTGLTELEAPVDCLVVHDGVLLAGTSGCRYNGCLGSVLQWNGTAWHPLDTGLSNRPIDGLAWHNGSLIATTGSRFGYFLACPPIELLRWDGTLWTTIREVGRYYFALGHYNSDLIVAGAFTNVGGADGNNLVRLSCAAPCAADFDNSGVVDSQDFFAFVTAFLKPAPGADFNHDHYINSQDFFDFLAAFFAGCG